MCSDRLWSTAASFAAAFSENCVNSLFVFFFSSDFSELRRIVIMASSQETHDVSFKPAFSRLSLSATTERFRIWDLRFTSFVTQQKPELSVCFEITEEEFEEFMKKKTSPGLMRAFSSLFIASVQDDILQRFSLQLDLKSQGLECYRRLSEQFKLKKEVEVSAEEVLLAVLSRKSQASQSVEQFLREVQDTLATFQRSADSSPPSVVERLLSLFVIQHVSAGKDFPWAATVFAPFLTFLRSDTVRRSPNTPIPVEHSLDALVDKVRQALMTTSQHVSMSTLVPGSRPQQNHQCTVCGRSGHTASRCWNRARSASETTGSMSGAQRRGKTAVSQLFSLSGPVEEEISFDE